MTNSPPGSQGHLNPGDPRVSFERFALGPELDALVRHVWIVRWSVPEGEEATQRVLSYPAFNAVLETSAHEDGPPVSLTLFPPDGACVDATPPPSRRGGRRAASTVRGPPAPRGQRSRRR
jgi:hypothetical protein